jgi:hypothetical protein
MNLLSVSLSQLITFVAGDPAGQVGDDLLAILVSRNGQSHPYLSVINAFINSAASRLGNCSQGHYLDQIDHYSERIFSSTFFPGI